MLGTRRRIVIREGLDLSISDAPPAVVTEECRTAEVALLGADHAAVNASLRVAEGDRVLLGQTLFVDRRRPEIRFASPASGIVRRARPEEGPTACLVVVEAEPDDEGLDFSFAASDVARVLESEPGELVARLLEAGEWPSILERPFDRIPDPDSAPDAVFVRLMDTSPLAPASAPILAGRDEDLRIGVAALSRLAQAGAGPTFVCAPPGLEPPVEDLPGVERICFDGPHPAGLPGTHIHHLFPLREGRRVWHVGLQETLAIGHLLRTARPDPGRVISLAGPHVREPQLIRTRRGASTEELVRGRLLPGECRVVSGTLLSGRTATRPESFLGRFHQQVSALPEVAEPSGRSWLVPFRRRGRPFPPWRRPATWSTERHGAPTAMLPLDVFDDIVPLQIPIALLLRALAAGDLESARRFGALELAEEDLALCSFLCPAKLEYGALLRAALDRFETGAA